MIGRTIKCCWNTRHKQMLPQLFQVLPNFWECFYTENCVLFVFKNTARKQVETILVILIRISSLAPSLYQHTFDQYLWSISTRASQRSNDWARVRFTHFQWLPVTLLFHHTKFPRSTSFTQAISVLSPIILPLQTSFFRVLLLRQQASSSRNLHLEIFPQRGRRQQLQR